MENPLLQSPGQLVLLAENDEDFLMIIRSAMEQAGFTGTLKVVKNTIELMNSLNEPERPDLAILDLNTWENEWRNALKQIKENKRYERIPVVVLRASGEPEDIEFCEKYRGCTYVQKPSTFEDWKACMEGVIRNNLT